MFNFTQMDGNILKSPIIPARWIIALKKPRVLFRLNFENYPKGTFLYSLNFPCIGDFTEMQFKMAVRKVWNCGYLI